MFFSNVHVVPYTLFFTDPESPRIPTTNLLEAEEMMEVCASSLTPLNPISNVQQAWASSLPQHLRFSEESLQVQQSMFETSSNTGAWCYCCMHVYHASSALALNLVNTLNPPFAPFYSFLFQHILTVSLFAFISHRHLLSIFDTGSATHSASAQSPEE